jgi:hypothetical protein
MEVFALGSVCFVKLVVARTDQIDALLLGNLVGEPTRWDTKSVHVSHAVSTRHY